MTDFPYDVIAYDVYGRNHLLGQINSPLSEVILGNQSAGVYLLKILKD